MRIWSLLPSATEILFVLGLDEQVTGVTHECDYPAAANKPRVTFSLVDSDRASRDIDAQVRERIHQGQRLYGIDEERLLSDPPDLIVTQDLCPVCAISPSDFAGHLEVSGCQARVICLNPNLLADVAQDIRQIAEAADGLDQPGALIANLQARIDHVTDAVGAAEQKPRVLCLEWLDPPMPAGHWLPQIVEIAGGDHGGLIPPGQPARKLPREEMLAFQPEVIVLMPCGFSSERAASESASLFDLDGWADLPALRRGQLFAVDANAYFSRPGSRLVYGLEILARILHPQCFSRTPPAGGVLKLPAPASKSTVEDWPSLFGSYP